MKKAKCHIAVLEFTCPQCDEFISHPDTGSHIFERTDIGNHPTLHCDFCKVDLEMPKQAKRIAGIKCD